MARFGFGGGSRGSSSATVDPAQLTAEVNAAVAGDPTIARTTDLDAEKARIDALETSQTTQNTQLATVNLIDNGDGTFQWTRPDGTQTSVNSTEVHTFAGALTGSAGAYTVGVDTTTDEMYYPDGAGNWKKAASDSSTDAAKAWQPNYDYTGLNDVPFIFTPTQTTAVDIDGNSLEQNKTYLGKYRVPKTAAASLTLAEIALIELVGGSAQTPDVIHVADETARLALTGLFKGTEVIQDDNGSQWVFDGTNLIERSSTVSTHKPADEAARLALTGLKAGDRIIQQDTEIEYYVDTDGTTQVRRYIGLEYKGVMAKWPAAKKGDVFKAIDDDKFYVCQSAVGDVTAITVNNVLADNSGVVADGGGGFMVDAVTVPAFWEEWSGSGSSLNTVTSIRAAGTADDVGVATEKAVRDAIEQLNFAGDYQGSAATFAGLPSSTTNGDWAILTADDGANLAGIYVTDGTAYTLAKSIPNFLLLSQAQITSITGADYTVQGLVSAERLDQWGQSRRVRRIFNTSANFDFTALSYADRTAVWIRNTNRASGIGITYGAGGANTLNTTLASGSTQVVAGQDTFNLQPLEIAVMEKDGTNIYVSIFPAERVSAYTNYTNANSSGPHPHDGIIIIRDTQEVFARRTGVNNAAFPLDGQANADWFKVGVATNTSTVAYPGNNGAPEVGKDNVYYLDEVVGAAPIAATEQEYTVSIIQANSTDAQGIKDSAKAASMHYRSFDTGAGFVWIETEGATGEVLPTLVAGQSVTPGDKYIAAAPSGVDQLEGVNYIVRVEAGQTNAPDPMTSAEWGLGNGYEVIGVDLNLGPQTIFVAATHNPSFSTNNYQIEFKHRYIISSADRPLIFPGFTIGRYYDVRSRQTTFDPTAGLTLRKYTTYEVFYRNKDTNTVYVQELAQVQLMQHSASPNFIDFAEAPGNATITDSTIGIGTEERFLATHWSVNQSLGRGILLTTPGTRTFQFWVKNHSTGVMNIAIDSFANAKHRILTLATGAVTNSAQEADSVAGDLQIHSWQDLGDEGYYFEVTVTNTENAPFRLGAYASDGVAAWEADLLYFIKDDYEVVYHSAETDEPQWDKINVYPEGINIDNVPNPSVVTPQKEYLLATLSGASNFIVRKGFISSEDGSSIIERVETTTVIGEAVYSNHFDNKTTTSVSLGLLQPGSYRYVVSAIVWRNAVDRHGAIVNVLDAGSTTVASNFINLETSHTINAWNTLPDIIVEFVVASAQVYTLNLVNNNANDVALKSIYGTRYSAIGGYYVDKNTVLEAEDAQVTLIDVDAVNGTLYNFSTGETWAQIKTNYEFLIFTGNASQSGTSSVRPYSKILTPANIELLANNTGFYIELDDSLNAANIGIQSPSDTDTGFTTLFSGHDAPANGRMQFTVIGVKKRFTVTSPQSVLYNQANIGGVATTVGTLVDLGFSLEPGDEIMLQLDIGLAKAIWTGSATTVSTRFQQSGGASENTIAFSQTGTVLQFQGNNTNGTRQWLKIVR